MPRSCERILVVQTAFLGDVVLTLPMVQLLHEKFPNASIDFLTIPRTSSILRNHPAIHEVIEFDKRGRDSGLAGLLRTATALRVRRYNAAIVPHRSLRSALLVWLSRIPLRIGFDTSAGSFLFTQKIRYQKNLHEIDRNITLLGPLDIIAEGKTLPDLFPSREDAKAVDAFLQSSRMGQEIMIAIAPGTVWNTKRWLADRFADVARRLADRGFGVVLLGGSEDGQLCEEIRSLVARKSPVVNAAGKLTLLQSAELLRRSRMLICNDSAPMHMAVAVRTPVVAIYGATIPEFGFAPYGSRDVVVETKGLDCRPCSIHGGDRCPIRTFVCMKEITPDTVLAAVDLTLEQRGAG